MSSCKSLVLAVKLCFVYGLFFNLNATPLDVRAYTSSQMLKLISSIELTYINRTKIPHKHQIISDHENQEIVRQLNKLIAQSLGECQNQSKKLLERLFAEISISGKPEIELSLKSNLIKNLVYNDDPNSLEQILYDCLLVAHEGKNTQATLILLISTGNFYSSIKEYTTAITIYKTINRIYAGAANRDAASYANINCARTYKETGNLDQSVFHLKQAKHLIDSIARIDTKSLLNLASVDIYLDLITAHPDKLKHLKPVVFDLIEQTQRLNPNANDAELNSYLNGYLGKLYELNNQFESALILTQKAWYYAQNDDLTDLYFPWQWQIGRIYSRLNDFELAIHAYDSALYHLDAFNQQSSQHYSFTEKINPFSEFTDLLLAKSDIVKNDTEKQYYYKKARDLIEKKKSFDLKNFLQDSCSSQNKHDTVDIDHYSPRTAIIYIIPVTDRIEFIISNQGQFYRFSKPVKINDLVQKINVFKRLIKKRTTFQFITVAKHLYNLLVQPYEKFLVQKDIDTLVLIPDNFLHDIPLAALHNGTDFLINNFAVALSPGLTLTKNQQVDLKQSKLLACGISEGIRGFSSLHYVPFEIQSIEAITNCRKIINNEFTYNKFADELLHHNYSFVHIASHGFLAERHSDSYLLTWNNKISVKQLESLLKPNEFRGVPIELLTLSACQSASSNSNTALGLAGIAYNSGVKSVIGTLWFINDQASSELITKFYNNLFSHKTISKAKALQNAQIELINTKQYRHPYYWSSFLIIGNWL